MNCENIQRSVLLKIESGLIFQVCRMGDQQQEDCWSLGLRCGEHGCSLIRKNTPLLKNDVAKYPEIEMFNHNLIFLTVNMKKCMMK